VDEVKKTAAVKEKYPRLRAVVDVSRREMLRQEFVQPLTLTGTLTRMG
jgi:hypothetical protein